MTACDPDERGRTLTAAWSATTMLWFGDALVDALVDRLGRVFDAIIDACRTKISKPDRTNDVAT